MTLAPIVAALTFALLSAPVAADTMPLRADEVVQVTLLPGWREAPTRHMAGLRMELAPGWKTYWRAPGDGGIPTRLQTTGSSNLVDVTIHWPRPKVFRVSGLRSLGYKNEVTLPLELALDASGPARLRAHLTFGVCRDICIPVEIRLEGDLPEHQERNGQILDAMATLPRVDDTVAQADCVMRPHGSGFELQVSVQTAFSGEGEAMAIELSDGRIWVSEPYLKRTVGWWHGLAKLMMPKEATAQIQSQNVRITLITQDDALDIPSCNTR